MSRDTASCWNKKVKYIMNTSSHEMNFKVKRCLKVQVTAARSQIALKDIIGPKGN